MAWYDVFGTEVHEGDYILSSALSTGRVKVGIASYSPKGSLMMDTVKQFHWGSEENHEWTSKRSAAGTHVVVLKTKDGVIPGPVQNLW